MQIPICKERASEARSIEMQSVQESSAVEGLFVEACVDRHAGGR